MYIKYSPELIKKAIRMRKQGYDGTAITIELGFENPNTVYHYTTPGLREKHRKLCALHNAKRRKIIN